ncbi:MAG: hypothetical protein LBQ33_06940 [Oscillospiraceae bacterium]|nr:hypothetical protein [Oscillospiraceae bacterium]
MVAHSKAANAGEERIKPRLWRRFRKDPAGRSKFLKLLIVSNAKTCIQGTCHGLDRKYLWRYLDAFCCRFERRGMQPDIFDHLLIAIVSACHFCSLS